MLRKGKEDFGKHKILAYNKHDGTLKLKLNLLKRGKRCTWPLHGKGRGESERGENKF